MKRKTAGLHTELVVRNPLGFFLGDTRIRLLEAVAQHGSITHAAKSVPLSYKAAWDAIDDMNNVAPEPLVTRSVGGRHGGGASLTAYGVKMIALYRTLVKRYEATADALSQQLDAVEAEAAGELQPLIERLELRTTARNQFVGTIEELVGVKDDVDVEITVRVDADFALCAVVTSDVVERLGLHPGRPVAAVVPATAVHLSTGTGLRVAARNRFRGRVLEVHSGPVNAEVTIELPSSRTLTASVTSAAVEELGLAPGVEAEAMFKASSLVLQSFDHWS